MRRRTSRQVRTVNGPTTAKSRRMTTLLVIGPTPPPHHGVAMAVRALLDSDLRRSFQVRHLELADRRGLQHVDRPDLRDVILFVAQWFRLLVILVRRRVRLVYIPLSQSTIGVVRDSLFMWPAYLLGARVVFHLHGGAFRAWYESRSPLMKAYVRAVLDASNRMVVLDESFRKLFDGLVPASCIDVVPNGVSDEGFARSAPSLRSGRPFRVLYLGTLSRAKGTLVFLEAVGVIAMARRDVEFVLAGEWWRDEDRIAAEAMLRRDCTTDLVWFPGRVEGRQKAELLASSDIFVFPGTQQEGQPLVVIEAMAAGLPVVFTGRGCLRNTVSAETGIEVPINDPRALASAVVRLVNRPNEIQRMGKAARRRYERCYTLDRFATDMVQVFVRALEDGHVPQRVSLVKDRI